MQYLHLSFLLFAFTFSSSYTFSQVKYHAEIEEDMRYKVHIDNGYKQVVSFFGEQLKPIDFRIYQNRKSIDKYWQKMSGNSEFKSPCWMIASSEKGEIAILSPRIWSVEACEHRSDDLTIQRLAAHELVHSYHYQKQFEQNSKNIPKWFSEGIAILVSGQLTQMRVDRTKEFVSKNIFSTLSQLWKGQHRYGLAGSMANFINETYGKKKLYKLLTLSSQDDLLNHLETNERSLLDSWKKDLLK